MKEMEPASTGLLGLFGNPVEHSFSPLFMNHALSLLDLNYRYLAFSIEENKLQHAVQALRTLKFRGINVTIPFKRSVISHLDHVHEKARKIGAVNCIRNDEGILTGYNTDQAGFIKPLLDRDIRIRDRRALIIGAGGAARAVVTGLVDHDISHMLLLNRTERNAASLVDWCREELHYKHMDYGGKPSQLEQNILTSCDLIVNTTPVGMHPFTEQSPVPDGLSFSEQQTVYDLVYNPLETRLLKHAREGDAVRLNGFEMLILQGLYSLACWFPQHEKKMFSLQHKIVDYTRQVVTRK
jgi:shikimate dehydrogenase